MRKAPKRRFFALCFRLRFQSLPLRMTILCDAFVFSFSVAPRQRATEGHRKSDVLKSHRYSQNCHSEIADKIRSRRFYLKKLPFRTACKFRLWQRRNFFCNLSFSKSKFAKGSEKEILRPVFSSSHQQSLRFTSFSTSRCGSVTLGV